MNDKCPLLATWPITGIIFSAPGIANNYVVKRALGYYAYSDSGAELIMNNDSTQNVIFHT